VLFLTLFAVGILVPASASPPASGCGGMACLGIQPDYCTYGWYQCVWVCGMTVYIPQISEALAIAAILSNPITAFTIGPIIVAVLAEGGFIIGVAQPGEDC
jgi:hypothetical protein